METMNMMSIDIERFIEEIQFDLEDENYDPVIGIGLSGIGKTMAIHELTQKLGIGFCELRLVTLTETDMLGLPMIKDGRTTYASNELLPMVERDGEKGILVLDELTSADRSVRAAAYQLLDSKRRLGNYKLPDKWKVVGLGNGPDDGGVFNGMEAAMLSRATCYRIEPDVECWKKWAVEHGVNPSVIAFLSFMPEMLHVYDPDELVGVFPCPRSWTALSTRLNAREKRTMGGVLNIDTVEINAAGAVGADAAPKFSAFYAYNFKQPINVDDIFEGRCDMGSLKEIKSEALYILTQQIVSSVENSFKTAKVTGGSPKVPQQLVLKVVNVCKWLVELSKVRLDAAIMGLRDIASLSPNFKAVVTEDERFDEAFPEFIDWCVEQEVVFR